jgi:hypothetical protein
VGPRGLGIFSSTALLSFTNLDFLQAIFFTLVFRYLGLLDLLLEVLLAFVPSSIGRLQVMHIEFHVVIDHPSTLLVMSIDHSHLKFSTCVDHHICVHVLNFLVFSLSTYSILNTLVIPLIVVSSKTPKPTRELSTMPTILALVAALAGPLKPS